MDIKNLEPQAIWQHFAACCAIPHPSGHEQTLAEHIAKWAKKQGLEVIVDEVSNVIIKKPATEGYEKAPGVILQAHLDMVPVKAPGVKHDFLTDPINPYIGEDGFVHAHGTTLGADDCIGVATALALLEDPKLQHGPLTAVFTVEEETTMKGAAHLDGKYLDGDYLINLDSETDGVIYVGCAGSSDIIINFQPKITETGSGFTALKLNLLDLNGGHSGTDIHLGHANAIASLAGILAGLDDYPILIAKLNGGQARNAIPAHCEAEIYVETAKLQDFKQDLLLAFEGLRAAHQISDPKMRLEVSEIASSAKAASADDSAKMLKLIGSLKIGPYSWSKIDPSIVQTSCNLGTCRFAGESLELCLMARSLDAQELEEAVRSVGETEYAKSLGEAYSYHPDSPHGSWQSPADNHLIRTLKKHWLEVYGSELKVTVLHAGLECGLFVKKAGPSLQLTSIGATILQPHSPSERVEIKGVACVYEAVKRTLSELK